MKIVLPVILLFIATLLFTPTPASIAGETNPWISVKTPAQGNPEAIGFYSAGCLRGAATLPPSGDGFQTMRPSRHRNFGHPVLVDYIESISRLSARAGLGGFLVGDLAMPRGGPTGSMHASHQIGLDVDIWYTQAPGHKHLTKTEREELPAQSMVAADEKHTNSLWTSKKEENLRIASEAPEVERIFVNPAIKKQICSKFAGQNWVGKLRPWLGHNDHFHVRLKCPASSAKCVVQDPPPAGDGCGNELDEWLTDEAISERNKPSQEPHGPPRMPKLPPECQAVLKAP